MCFQVVERYSLCRCLYYKHSIDQCSAYGQQGHVIQEKTVLVGHSCSSHSTEVCTECYAETESQKHWDQSEDEETVVSTAITTFTGLSNIPDQRDAIDEILKTLVNDPLLNWPKLFRLAEAKNDFVKDVRFFLGTFEYHLRTVANSVIEVRACRLLRTRIPYFSDQIHQHFHVNEKIAKYNSPNQTAKNEDGTGIQDDAEDIDETIVPSFGSVRQFLFEGQSYSSLKEDIRNYVQFTRDPIAEIVDILVKDPTLRTLWWKVSSRAHLKEDSAIIGGAVGTFLLNLADEASRQKISAADIEGIISAANNVSFVAHLIKEQVVGSNPDWHYVPLVLATTTSLSSTLGNNGLELSREAELFHHVVAQSSAIDDLKDEMYQFACRPSRLCDSDSIYPSGDVTSSDEVSDCDSIDHSDASSDFDGKKPSSLLLQYDAEIMHLEMSRYSCHQRGAATQFCGGSSSDGQHSAAACATTDNGNVSQINSHKRSRRGHIGRRDDDEKGSGNEDWLNERRTLKPKSSSPDSFRFACPFFKHDPEKYGGKVKYRSCTGPGWETIHRVKSHLYRRHLRHQCTRCWECFKKEGMYRNHLLQDTPCERVDPPKPADGIDEVQRDNLKKKSKPEGVRTDSDMWRWIYKILFPAVRDEQVPSPYYDPVYSQQDVRQLLDRVTENEPEDVQHRLRSNLNGLLPPRNVMQNLTDDVGGIPLLPPRNALTEYEGIGMPPIIGIDPSNSSNVLSAGLREYNEGRSSYVNAPSDDVPTWSELADSTLMDLSTLDANHVDLTEPLGLDLTYQEDRSLPAFDTLQDQSDFGYSEPYDRPQLPDHGYSWDC